MTAPEVFDQDEDDGLVLLLHAEPPTAHRAAAQLAAGVRPSGAITLDEPESGRS